MKKPDQFSRDIAMAIFLACLILIFGTLFGFWIKFFWVGYVFASQ